MTRVNTQPGGVYSSGVSGLTCISQVQRFTQFCHIERPSDLRLRNTALELLYFNNLVFLFIETVNNNNVKSQTYRWIQSIRETCRASA